MGVSSLFLRDSPLSPVLLCLAFQSVNPRHVAYQVLEKQDDENANMDTNTEANATSEWDILALDCAVDLPHLSQAMCALKQVCGYSKSL